MTPARPIAPAILFAASLCLAAIGCAGEQPPTCTEASLSTCRSPTQTEEHYVAESLRYFDTLDDSADPDSKPAYAELVARWEWPPWLLLTGYGAEMIDAVDQLVLVAQPGTTVPERECRAFDVQPFGRCRVVFDYEGLPCPIYEEFTFDDDGRMTFIEAWSDPGGDSWEEAGRLSTRIPGLGSDTGRIDPTGEAMTAAAATDADVADFAARTQDFWGSWSQVYEEAGDDLYKRGCGW